MSDLLAHLERGPMVESRHFGEVVVADAQGRLVAHAGSPDQKAFMRSAAKPFQTMAVVLTGAADRFALSAEDLAVISASHNGETVHTERVMALLERAGLDEGHLQCGVHPPKDRETAVALAGPPSSRHSNCSGNHVGMLLNACHLGTSLDYLPLDHPVQQVVLDVIAEVSRVPRTDIVTATDGCGVPTFGLSLKAMAGMFAALATPQRLGRLADAADRVVSAIVCHPYLVAGRGRFDTELMEAAGGRMLVKGGAEGVLCGVDRSRGLGFAIKVQDGSDRAIGPVAMRLLSELQLLDGPQMGMLERWHEPAVHNVAGQDVGRLLAVYRLTRTA